MGRDAEGCVRTHAHTCMRALRLTCTHSRSVIRSVRISPHAADATVFHFAAILESPDVLTALLHYTPYADTGACHDHMATAPHGLIVMLDLLLQTSAHCTHCTVPAVVLFYVALRVCAVWLLHFKPTFAPPNPLARLMMMHCCALVCCSGHAPAHAAALGRLTRWRAALALALRGGGGADTNAHC